MNIEFLKNFLNSFFHLFEANIENINIDNDKITGFVVWEDEDEKQEFLWNIPKNNFNYENTTELINFIIQNRLIEEDMITISKDSLITKLKNSGWDLQKINNSLNTLCSVRISMINEGEVTDYFLIHF